MRQFRCLLFLAGSSAVTRGKTFYTRPEAPEPLVYTTGRAPLDCVTHNVHFAHSTHTYPSFILSYSTFSSPAVPKQIIKLVHKQVRLLERLPSAHTPIHAFMVHTHRQARQEIIEIPRGRRRHWCGRSLRGHDDWCSSSNRYRHRHRHRHRH